jgi:signal transduction histidine kinase
MQFVSVTQVMRPYLMLILIMIMAMIPVKRLKLNMVKMLVSRISSLKQSLDIKDIYTASMIHELRNPLNAVLGSIGLLRLSNNLSSADLETLNIASVSGEILITLINNALDGAKLEANRLELDPHMNDIVEMLSKAASLFQWKAKEK